MLKLNIDFLKFFIDVAKYKSITKASTKGNISQAALSQQIKTIERTLGVKLFDRTHKGVELTDMGKIFHKHAVSITTSYNQMLEEIIKLQENTLNLHIIATQIVCCYALLCTIYNIKNRFPSYVLEVETMPSIKIEEKIMQGIGDIGIIAGEPENKTLFYKKVFSDKYYLVSGLNMNLPDSLSFDELCNFPLLRLTKTQKTRRLLDDYFKNKGIDTDRFNTLYDLDSIESLKVSALRNFGLAFLPHIAIKKELYNKQLKIIKLDNFDFECPYYMIKRRNDHAIEIKQNIIANFEKILLYCVYDCHKCFTCTVPMSNRVFS